MGDAERAGGGEGEITEGSAQGEAAVLLAAEETEEGADKLRAVRQKLYALKPEFCSVTFGAGGSTQEGTFNAVSEILAEGVNAASHISCIGATHQTVRAQLATLKAMGVKRLVALRGDMPSGYGAGGEFHYASDLVAFIRAV